MFPKDFVWGAASSAYQVEGGAFADGKGESVWDEYCRIPGKIFEGHTGDVACDHYHRFREDVEMMAQMGLKAYRFSLSWSRILPEGTGRIEPRGIQFYRDLITELKNHGITPYITLFHWDYPVALMRRGGWLNPESPQWFAEYAQAAAEGLGDLAEHFITINEPEMIIGNTFLTGNLAPGVIMSEGDLIRMIHNLLIAHGKAVQVLRRLLPKAKIGIAPCSDPVVPDKLTPELIDGAREYYYRAGSNIEELTFGLSWYSDPVVLGTYPEDGLKCFAKHLPENWQEDMKTICQPLDFMGHNIYTGVEVTMGPDGKVVPKPHPVGYPRSCLGWHVLPQSLYWGPRFLYERYGLPVIITENGLSCHDWVSLDGEVHDPNRIDYLHRYLWELRRACADGIPVQGYFHWSLMDNLEWKSGYHERFGLVYVDYQTLKRTPKDSAQWYKSVIESNGENL